MCPSFLWMWIWLTGHAIRLNDYCQQVWAATDHLRITPAATPVVTFLPRSTQKSLLHHYISTEYALLYYYTRLNSHYCIITWLLSSHDCNRSTHEGQSTAILTLHCFFQSGKFRGRVQWPHPFSNIHFWSQLHIWKHLWLHLTQAAYMLFFSTISY